MHATLPLLSRTDFPPLRRRRTEVLQVNLGYTCNQSCLHCHVNAGPTRTEQMSAENIRAVLDFIRASDIRQLDLTGGAPEMNPHFRSLVTEARALGAAVMDRCNLTILSEPGHEGLATFLAEQRVQVTASLPCYLEDNVDRQRGNGVFARSIAGLKQLNALGYGRADSGLELNLVFNPQGPALPPPQAQLEEAYREHLGRAYGIVFTRLLTLANMPIQRFGSTLVSKGLFTGYMELLRGAHRDDNLQNVMCRNQLSVDWQGHVYDCDFNQMLGLPLRIEGRPRTHLSQLLGRDLDGNPVVVADHCYGCTAGQGSSCGGALN
ncbi:MAG: arsenosugar biosynthesis radical SAM protein ArsS [Methyloversatilis discipulorum]|uniref:arsenosugar biosynthesis radical SAM (seleno)protein ArsS n=1 Tax=Methyloversatilis discipulorum TaxID=1119528 RepID=UPI0026E9BA2D|nr:arsenosugar biosynthesis radical SAM (seleno)protein ArsS [Methyloversatilis discipulorum]MBT9517017.1 arsenosugar biosynthesis radical SAM protein ArsS [Methyloversatilis discipulorum]